MRLTARQTTTRTLTDLLRALDNRQAVTITYVDSKGETTVRTVELYEVHAKAGDYEIVAMCRLRNEQMKTDKTIRTAQRSFDLSNVVSYTVHRMAYVLTRPEPTTYERPAPAPADDADALYIYELQRDPGDADYRPRVKLTQTSTDLAA
ncbi:MULTISPECIES: WYL domain-containing protein [unclassified Streptomyces]|uniref:WYL domain-containing protein n=1 Tax=unclassified Streptomyces TaxID=2593676 RepID=UPI0036EBF033